MEITINKSHFLEGVKYDNILDCPLCVAIRELIPGCSVTAGGSYVTVNGKDYTFVDYETVDWSKTWGGDMWLKINNGEIDSFTFNIPTL